MNNISSLQEEPRLDPVIERIRWIVAAMRAEIAQWEPRPMPTKKGS